MELIHQKLGNYILNQDPKEPLVSNDWVDVVVQAINKYEENPDSVEPLYKEHNNTMLYKNLLTLMKKNVKLHNTTIERELIKVDLYGR